MNEIIIPLSMKQLVDVGLLLHTEHIFGILNSIGCVIVVLLKRYSSAMEVSINLNVGCKRP